jgi:hypothetical protein
MPDHSDRSIPDQDSAATRVYTVWQSSSQSSETPEEETLVVLPRTRYRFGRPLAGRPDPGPAPNPTLPTRENDPVRAAIGVLRSVGTLSRRGASGQARQARTPGDDPSAGASDLASNTDRPGAQEEPHG